MPSIKFKKFKFDWEAQYLAMTEDAVWTNTFKHMKDFARVFAECDTKPEFEVYDTGMVNNIAFMLEKGMVKRPVYIQFVLGILGGLTATSKNLLFWLIDCEGTDRRILNSPSQLPGEVNFRFVPSVSC